MYREQYLHPTLKHWAIIVTYIRQSSVGQYS